MSKWSLFLFAACLWGLSHLRPLAYHSDGLSQSIWSVSSADGELVWAWVELSGPDPERELGTTAAASLEGYINESRGYLCRVHSESQGSSRSPGAALSQIHKLLLLLELAAADGHLFGGRSVALKAAAEGVGERRVASRASRVNRPPAVSS